MGLRFACGWVVVALACGACAQEAPPPFAEALFVVDTDLPVPQIAGRLRVDLYAADGTWFESRDIARADAASWPASFSVFSPEAARTTRVIVRLRTYPEGLERDYRGERFADEHGEPADGARSTENDPRLVKDGVDVTPSREPQVTVAVDRLVLVKLFPGKRGRVRVTLHGACAGTMSRLSMTAPYQTPTFTEAQTCITDAGQRVPLVEEVLEDDMSIPPATALGTFGVRAGCDPTAPGAPADPRAICIPGGVFILGSETASGLGTEFDASPERVAVIDRFWLDRHEVTVGQLRTAIAAGLDHAADWPAKNAVIAHEGTLGKADPADVYPFDEWCTYSAQPGSHEDFPVSCVSWKAAHAYCNFIGGELPSEAQWEYAAAAAGRTSEVDYPWGNDAPTCDRVVYGRVALGGAARDCMDVPEGPVRADDALGDVTPLGVIGMGGNMSELVLDEDARFTDPCWRGAAQENPVCTTSTRTSHVLRGGSFLTQSFAANVAARNDDATPSFRSIFGFRCAFNAAPGKP